MNDLKFIFEGNNLLTFLLVLVCLMGLYVLFGNAVKTHRELHKPNEEKDKDLKTRVRTMETTVADHSEEINDLHEGVRVQCQAVMALLNHAIHNGNTEEMEKAASELNTYLSNKI